MTGEPICRHVESAGSSADGPRLDEWTVAGSVFRGMADLDEAKRYAERVARFLELQGCPAPVFVVAGPTSTTKQPFEVVAASCGYRILHRINPPRLHCVEAVRQGEPYSGAASMKITDPTSHGCYFERQYTALPADQRTAHESPLVDIPEGQMLCGPAAAPLMQRHSLLLDREFGAATPDMSEADVWAICDALMEHEGYETLAHFMPPALASEVKERTAREAAGDPQARMEWQARVDLARSGATSTCEISARAMAASALADGYAIDYFDSEAIWLRRAFRTGAQREWEVLRSDPAGGHLAWVLPGGVMSRVMRDVAAEMRERGMLPPEEQVTAQRMRA